MSTNIPTFTQLQAQHAPAQQATKQAEQKSTDAASITTSNIQIGRAVVPYAPASKSKGLQAGWVLPGGQRTSSHEQTTLVAQSIEKIFQRSQQIILANQIRRNFASGS